MNLIENINLNCINAISSKRIKLYNKLGIFNIIDLLEYYPSSYLNYECSVNQNYFSKNDDKTINIEAKVVKKSAPAKIKSNLTANNFKTKTIDTNEYLDMVIYNNYQKYKNLELDKIYIFKGKLKTTRYKSYISVSNYIDPCITNSISAVYKLTEGLTQERIKDNIKTAIKLVNYSYIDPIPNDIRKKCKLCSKQFAIQNIHFPENENALKISKYRLIFEELLILQLGLIKLKNQSRTTTSIKLLCEDLNPFYNNLPFQLTQAQIRAINDCVKDMKSNVPMNRLIQGDVGSGKTMVAAALCYLAGKSKIQSAIMAPTEILAEQHYKTLIKTLNKLEVTSCLLTGSISKKQKNIIKSKIKNGLYDIVVGTQALIQDDVEFKNLGLVITDEQHRFGTQQRSKLINKGHNCHIIVMSATPIPRTLALIIYSDLDISIIDQLPIGRIPIKTFAINQQKRNDALNFVKKHLLLGQQAYIICPLVEQSEQLNLENVIDYYNNIKDNIFKEYKVGLLHGKLKSIEKEKIISEFNENKINILVSTTVIEVGIDVPNATFIVIENADRFGLSQLHQLRGRIGRGILQSYCILINSSDDKSIANRLKVMCNISNGFKIAEYDLRMRGPGDFFGNRQHGLPKLSIANINQDIAIIEKTKKLALSIMEIDPDLKLSNNIELSNAIKKLFYKTNLNDQNNSLNINNF